MTHRYMTIAAIGFAALITGLVVGPAEAGSWMGGYETTHMTFSDPVRIPGATLPAGSYVFRLTQSKHAVWIIDEEDGTVFGPYLTRPRQRRGSRADNKRVILVDRTADAGGVPVIRAWFGRYQDRGYEFVYPTHSAN